MKSTNKSLLMKWINRIFFILAFSTLLWICIVVYSNSRNLKKQSKISIGIVTEYKLYKFRYDYYYNFSVRNIKYQGAKHGENLKPKDVIGKRFYVRYYPLDPHNSEILFDHPVSDSLMDAPQEGWEKLPLH